MPLIVYFDEVGNPTLNASDKDFPVFAIAMFICDTDCYVNQIVPRVNRLKFDYFGHEGVVLHSRDIRKTQADFGFLTGPDVRAGFMADLSGIMDSCDYRLLAVAIRSCAESSRRSAIPDTDTPHIASAAARPVDSRAHARTGDTQNRPASDTPPSSPDKPLRWRIGVETRGYSSETTGAPRPYTTGGGVLKQPDKQDTANRRHSDPLTLE